MSFKTMAAAVAAVVLLLPPDGKPRKAPSVSMKTLDGRSAKLADHKGHVVVVDFWASWCVPCKATFPALDALATDMKDRGVEVLAVSEDEKRKDLDAFLAGTIPSMQVLIDPRGDAAGAFGVTAIPSMFVIDAEGFVRFSHSSYAIDVLAAVRGEIDELVALPQSQPKRFSRRPNF